MTGTDKQIAYANSIIAAQTKRFGAIRAEVKATVAAFNDCSADDAAKTIAFADSWLDDAMAVLAGDDAGTILDTMTIGAKAFGLIAPVRMDADRLIRTAFAIMDGDARQYAKADADRFARVNG